MRRLVVFGVLAGMVMIAPQGCSDSKMNKPPTATMEVPKKGPVPADAGAKGKAPAAD
jgi:hypothetical protein